MKRIFDIRLEFNDLPDEVSAESMIEYLKDALYCPLNDFEGKITRCIEEPVYQTHVDNIGTL